jgi:hypothetical protein
MLNERLSGYDNGFGSGLGPIGSVGIAPDDHAGLAASTRWMGSWTGPGHTGGGGEAGWAASGFRPIRLGKIENHFPFSIFL